MGATYVHISFKRVQTWLFTVPRLQAMVGANTCLGEVLRTKLPELAEDSKSSPKRWSLVPAAPAAITIDRSLDPLAADVDDPVTDAARGVMSRDGGHFEAQFRTRPEGEAFAKAARQLIRDELPGLRFGVEIFEDPLSKDRDVTEGTFVSNELPVLEPCQWTGRGLAAGTIAPGGEEVHVSTQVGSRVEAAKRSLAGQATDLASFLTAQTALANLDRPLERFS